MNERTEKEREGGGKKGEREGGEKGEEMGRKREVGRKKGREKRKIAACNSALKDKTRILSHVVRKGLLQKVCTLTPGR